MLVYSEREHDRYLLTTKVLNGSMAFVAFALGAWILASPERRVDPQWVFWLIWPMATLHTVEEYIIPGNFLRYFNREAFQSPSALGPLTAKRAFYTDALTGVINPILLYVLGMLYLPAIWFFYGLLSVNAAFHITETIRTGKYFAGVGTSILLYFPGFTAISYFYLEAGLLTLEQVYVTFGLALFATAMFFRQVRQWQVSDLGEMPAGVPTMPSVIRAR